MQYAIQALDILTVAMALALAATVRRSFFYLSLFLCIVLGILRLHYGLQYSWTFVGKITADFAIPLMMGWAGVHLAAEIKADRERKLWQAVFGLLAVFGLITSFLVERQLDVDHKTEIGDLRGGIKDDVTTAIFRYNESHPQHPVTSEQFAEFTRSLNTKTSTQTVTSVKPGKWSSLSNNQLRDEATRVIQQLREQLRPFNTLYHDAANNSVRAAIPVERARLVAAFAQDPGHAELFAEANYVEDVVETRRGIKPDTTKRFSFAALSNGDGESMEDDTYVLTNQVEALPHDN